MLHLLTLKRTGALRELSPLSPRAAAAVSRASELVLTRAGFWLPGGRPVTAASGRAPPGAVFGRYLPRRPSPLKGEVLALDADLGVSDSSGSTMSQAGYAS